MRSTSFFLFLVTTLSALGCVSALKVHEETTGPEFRKLRGIPFHTKVQICRQTTTYAGSWYEVTITEKTRVFFEKDDGLEVKELAAPSSTRRVDKGALSEIRHLQQLALSANACQRQELCDFERTLKPSVPSGSDIYCLQQYLNRGDFYEGGIDGAYGETTKNAVASWQGTNRVTADGIFGPESQGLYYDLEGGRVPDCLSSDAVFEAFGQLPPPGELEHYLISNSSEPVVVVNYQRELYLNGKLPWFGETAVTTKLNADGTLSEASTTVKSSPESIGSLIPLKELLTATFIPGVAEAAEEMALIQPPIEARGGVPAVERLIEISIVEDGYRWVFRRDQSDSDGLCHNIDRSPIDFETNGDFTREPLEQSKTTKKEADQQIEFSGSVKLPKKKGDS